MGICCCLRDPQTNSHSEEIAKRNRISAGQKGFRRSRQFMRTFAPCFARFSTVADVYLLSRRDLSPALDENYVLGL